MTSLTIGLGVTVVHPTTVTFEVGGTSLAARNSSHITQGLKTLAIYYYYYRMYPMPHSYSPRSPTVVVVVVANRHTGWGKSGGSGGRGGVSRQEMGKGMSG